MIDSIPAATLVLFRRGASDVEEHLFVERSARMRFAAGATVFPGGRVDPDDRSLAARFNAYEPEDAAARIAALRETIEECGVAVGLKPPPTPARIAVLREALASGRAFSAILDELTLGLDLDALVPFTRWQPNLPETRVFDTRFYLARWPDGHPAAEVDNTENVRLFWATAQTVLDEADAGRLHIIFPTRRNLERLSALGSYAAVCAQLSTLPTPPQMIEPWIETRDGGEQFLCIPSTVGYPVTEQPLQQVRRG